jgi:hypothetical protein
VLADPDRQATHTDRFDTFAAATLKGRRQMTDQQPITTKGIVLHIGRFYDVFCGPLARMTDRPILDLAQIAVGDRLLDIGTGPG